jgi:hypothetical protein
MPRSWLRGPASFIAAACLAAALATPAEAAPRLHKAFWGPSQVNGVSQFPIYHDLGVDIFQTAINWANAAPRRPRHPTRPSDPAYRWPTDIDYAIQQGRRYGVRVLIMLVGAPRWANGGHRWPYAPSQARGFAHFARAAARRYPGVHHWMIWGEPCRSGNFRPIAAQPNFGQPLNAEQQRAPRRYARLLDAAYGALKAVSRRNLVIGGNCFTTGDVSPVAWADNMRLPDGRPPRMDIYGHNPFSYRKPDLRNPPSGIETVDFSDLGRFSDHINAVLGAPRGRRLPLFVSEWTVPTTRTDIEFNFHVTLGQQWTWIRGAFRVARALGDRMYGVGWIHLYDQRPDPKHLVGVIEGGLITWDHRRKPGYYAFQRG